MGRGKFKGKPTGRRQFSTPEEMHLFWVDLAKLMVAGTSSRPRTFKKNQEVTEEVQDEISDEECEEESEEESEKGKGPQGIIQTENPNLSKPKNLKARDVDLEKTTELSRREREEIEKQRAHERYMKLQEQGKTEQSRKDLDRLSLIRRKEPKLLKNGKKKKPPKIRKNWKFGNDYC